LKLIWVFLLQSGEVLGSFAIDELGCGFFTVTLPSGMITHDCMLHKKDNRRWIGIPSREYESQGKRKFAPIITFVDRAAEHRFYDQILAALDRNENPCPVANEKRFPILHTFGSQKRAWAGLGTGSIGWTAVLFDLADWQRMVLGAQAGEGGPTNGVYVIQRIN